MSGGEAGGELRPAFAGYADAVRRSFARQGLMTAIGARLALIEPGRVILELPFSAAVSQQHGFFHGGVIGALGDNSGGYATLTLLPEGSEVLTVEYKVNFVRPAKGGLLRAEGHVVRAGRSLSVTRMEVRVVDGTIERTCAVLQATMMRAEAAA